MIKRSSALFWVFIGWLLLETCNWALNTFLSSTLNKDNLLLITDIIKPTLEFLTSGFTYGFITGAAIFSIWDWPLVGIWLRKQRERLRNKEQDEQLAAECETLSQNLYEAASRIERIRSESHWASARSMTSEGSHDAWIEARRNEAREEEQIRRQYGSSVSNLLVKLKRRGLNMDLWSFSLRSHDLYPVSMFLADIAQALKDGTYLENTFSVDRRGLPHSL